MRRTEALQGVRMIRFLDVLGRYEAAEFNQMEAAELLGIDERTFRRWRQRFEDDGEAGLLDRRLGKASGKRVPVDRERRGRDPVSRRVTAASPPSISTSIWWRPRLPLGLHLDEDVPSFEGLAAEGEAARRASAQAAASAVAGDDAASGRLAS